MQGEISGASISGSINGAPIVGEVANTSVAGDVNAGTVVINEYVVTTSDITGGHRITVVKGVQTQTVDVLDGVDGEKGDTGEQGPKGDTGSQGPKGDTGEQGPKGDTGEQGPAGTNGTDGQDGSDGYAPVVTVSPITGGHNVTITDATHIETPHSFNVMDGTGSGDEMTSNKVTSLSAESTDTQYPSAKCVYDLLGDVESILDGIIGGV